MLSAYVQDVSILAALIVFAINPKGARERFLFLGLALLCIFSTEMFSLINVYVFRKMANPIITIGTLFSTSAYLVFYRTLFTSKSVRSMITAIFIVYVAFALINLLFIQGINKSSYTLTLRSVSLIVVSLSYFYSLGKEHLTTSVTQLPMFWINTAVLIYYAGTFFHWLLIDYLIVVIKTDVTTTYTLKNALGVLYYMGIAIALWYNRTLYLRKSNSPPDATVQ